MGNANVPDREVREAAEAAAAAIRGRPSNANAAAAAVAGGGRGGSLVRSGSGFSIRSPATSSQLWSGGSLPTGGVASALHQAASGAAAAAAGGVSPLALSSAPVPVPSPGALEWQCSEVGGSGGAGYLWRPKDDDESCDWATYSLAPVPLEAATEGLLPDDGGDEGDAGGSGRGLRGGILGGAGGGATGGGREGAGPASAKAAKAAAARAAAAGSGDDSGDDSDGGGSGCYGGGGARGGGDQGAGLGEASAEKRERGFQREVTKTFLRCLREGVSPTNAIIERNALKVRFEQALGDRL